MYNRTQQGSALLVVLFVVCVLALFASLGFGFWAFKEMNSYKNDYEAKAAIAVKQAEEVQKTKLAADFAEREKLPIRSYSGPDFSGSVSFSYPKTWSAHIDEAGKGTAALVGYLHPAMVPSLDDTSFALRIEVVNSPYDQVVKSFDSNIKAGKVKATAYVPKKLEGNKSVVPGLRLDGEVISKKQGSMILLKVRDKTLKVWTESNDYLPDYNNIILPSLTIVP